MEKALIAMSGGVDSGVAACMMKEQGYSCIGVTMKLFRNEEIGLSREHTCCSLSDVEDARSVARLLGIPYYVFNFSDRFTECVIDKFIRAYENGITPNPCIDCNRYLKFDKLFQRAKEIHCDYVVTGHYARAEYDAVSGRYLLKKAFDAGKDQSYVLYSMTQEQLRHTLFPLGKLTKPEVRKIAEEHGFCNAGKHDSQDICFVTNGSYTVSRLEKTERLRVKVRYHQPEQWAAVTQLDEDTLEVIFDTTQRAVAKGQAVVLYDGDIVVGGGTITER
ncbi:MAG: hypothetical protein PUC73_08030 [Lachnospiraceae bacterium]|nr:hypothetical protein [Lachnospiraceae bacterium]